MNKEKYFLPYQRAWLLDRCRLKICEKSRQVGLSYVDSYDSVRKAAVYPGGRDVWVMSRDELQARQYIRYCRHWANLLKLGAADYGERVYRQKEGRGALVQVLSFASGASIYALSSNPDAIVGKSGHVKLDEFALHKDQRTLYAVAKPVIQWGGTLSIISTHRGIGTVFNEILTDIRQHGNRMGWSLHSVPIQKAVEEGLVERIEKADAEARAKNSPSRHLSPNSPSPQPLASRRGELSCVGNWPMISPLPPGEGRGEGPFGDRGSGQAEFSGPGETPGLLAGEDACATKRRQAWLGRQRAECIDEEQWLQEYCCVPADEASAFISYDLLNACTEPGLCLLTLEELLAQVATDAPTHRPTDAPTHCLLSQPSTLKPQLSTNPQLFLGLDVARKKDLCVFDVGEKIGDVVWDRARLEFLNRSFGEIEEVLYRLLRLPQLKRACLDATGVGLQLAERARERFGWKVEAVNFSSGTKEELATGLKVDLEKRQVRLVDDDKLRADMRAIRKELTLGGNARYGGESEGSHCDRFWAKALRQQAARYRVRAGALVG